MKTFWQLMAKDIQKENFTRKEIVIYGIIVPIAFIALIVFGELIDMLIKNI